MKWYYKVLGGHTHVRVFMNGGKCGDLCFRNEEFDLLQSRLCGRVDFIAEAPAPPPEVSHYSTHQHLGGKNDEA